MSTARIRENILRITDSVRNWVISKDLLEPTTFRIPTSLDLVVERAVARFMKLIQAMIRIRMAITENIYT